MTRNPKIPANVKKARKQAIYSPFSSSRSVITLMERYPDGIVSCDQSGIIGFANEKAEAIFGTARGNLIGRPIDTIIAPDHRNEYRQHLKHLIDTKSKVVASEKFETRGLKQGRLDVPIEVSLHMIRERQTRFILCVIEDISVRIALQEQLYQQTITDPLTGLYNRRYFDEIIRQEFKRASRYRRLFSVVSIDIDGFKQTNDLFGHVFGDKMLVQATQVFREIKRDGDSVYRYGGDEFAMILPETTKEGAIEVSERLRTIFAKKCSGKEKRLKLSLSIGVASHPEDAHDEQSLIGAADRRLYMSKESGGNVITAYDQVTELANDNATLLRSLSTLVRLMERKLGWAATSGISHSQELRALGVEIGRKLGLSSDRVNLIEQAAMLHDIGTLHISNKILNKNGKLSKREMAAVKQHVLIGEEIIELVSTSDHSELLDLKNIVGQHHEWIDGTGYPRGLKGDEIRLEARILAVTDAYNSMSTRRPYREALSPAHIVAELRRNAGKQFDPRIVDILIDREGLF